MRVTWLAMSAMVLVTSAVRGGGFEAGTTLVSAAALRDDLTILRRALEEIHPGLHRSLSGEELEQRFAQATTECERDRTHAEAFLVISRLTAAVRCGHTFPNPHNQTKGLIARLTAGRNRLPILFRWIDRRMIVERDVSKHEALPAGSEVLKIDGVPVAEILSSMMAYARADGGNDAKRISLLEVSAGEEFETFDLYYPLLFPMNGEEFEIEAVPYGDTNSERFVMQGITHEERKGPAGNAMSSAEDEPLWEMASHDDSTAYLRMSSWVAYKTKWDWEGFIHRELDSLAERGVANLVIDLRGNEGGSGVGEVIAARLIETPVAYSNGHRFVKYVKTPPDLDPLLDTWDPSFRDWTALAAGPMDLSDRNTGLREGHTSGFYGAKSDLEEGADSRIAPVGPRYAGRVFVLIDSSNSSATFQFAVAVKRHRLGTLVGRPTGGNLRGINGGAFFFLRLPNSGIEVDLPIFAGFPREGEPLAEDAGVEPDVLVEPTAADIAGGVDAEMREVKRLIAVGR